ncbi:hypothetical protein E4U55_002772 [Claviceps digitariae]|nr:hypothetical protein E4U55_002772 [Claviceps digitariae]
MRRGSRIGRKLVGGRGGEEGRVRARQVGGEGEAAAKRYEQRAEDMETASCGGGSQIQSDFRASRVVRHWWRAKYWWLPVALGKHDLRSSYLEASEAATRNLHQLILLASRTNIVLFLDKPKHLKKRVKSRLYNSPSISHQRQVLLSSPISHPSIFHAFTRGANGAGSDADADADADQTGAQSGTPISRALATPSLDC